MYNFRIETKKVLIKANSNLSLYDACVKTVGIDGGVVIESGRLVAFYCSYTSMVKAGFGAFAHEKLQIQNFTLGR